MKILHFIILSLFFLNCSKFTDPPQPENHFPVFEKILVSPIRPQINSVVKLTAIAYDADKDQLYYRWSASGGSMTNNSYGNPMYWSTPNNIGTYIIICYATDQVDVSVKNIVVEVFDDTNLPENQ